jgi:hypothetical protein
MGEGNVYNPSLFLVDIVKINMALCFLVCRDASTVMDVDGQDPPDQPDTRGQITEDSLATDTSTTEGGDDSRVCAPQVKIGEDGCIILDEER